MSKLFFDVFPELKVNQDMEKLLADVEVTKVSTNRQQNHLRVYLLSTRLIWKSNFSHLNLFMIFPHLFIQVSIIPMHTHTPHLQQFQMLQQDLKQPVPDVIRKQQLITLPQLQQATGIICPLSP